MSKLDDAVGTSLSAMTTKLGMKTVDVDLLRKIAKSLGPSLYRSDSKYVACADKKERAHIRKNFLVKKLGLADTDKLDDSIQAVCEQVAPLKNAKHRPVVYYLLTKKHRKSGVFA